MKFIFTFIIVFYSYFSFGCKYDQIKKDFISYSSKNITDYTTLSSDEITYYKSKLSMSDFILRLPHDNVILFYPKEFYPNHLSEYQFGYFYLFFNFNDLNLNINDLYEFKEYINKYISINNQYISDFIFIHELSHLFSEQDSLPKNVDIFNIYVDNPINQYQEIISDLFAVIYLTNYFNYNINDIDNIIILRNFGLYFNKDLLHFSTPYLKELKSNYQEWKDLKNFKEINSYIKTMYSNVTNKNKIGFNSFKKEKESIKLFCHNFNKNYSFSKNKYLDQIYLKCK